MRCTAPRSSATSASCAHCTVSDYAAPALSVRRDRTGSTRHPLTPETRVLECPSCLDALRRSNFAAFFAPVWTRLYPINRFISDTNTSAVSYSGDVTGGYGVH